jgi:hypothetical protein
LVVYRRAISEVLQWQYGDQDFRAVADDKPASDHQRLAHQQIYYQAHQLPGNEKADFPGSRRRKDEGGNDSVCDPYA